MNNAEQWSNQKVVAITEYAIKYLRFLITKNFDEDINIAKVKQYHHFT